MPPSATLDNPSQSQSHSQSQSQTQSQSQLRPNLTARHRSTSSVTSHQTDSPAGTPPASGTTATQHKEHKTKGERKHVVGGGKYGRVSSNKALHKLSRQTNTQHSSNNHTSNDSIKEFQAPWDKPHNSSTNLSRQKNHSQTGLKRNRSLADVQHTPGSTRRPKSSDGPQGTQGKKRPNSVHFELGIGTLGKVEVEDDNEEGWEEASSSASPALSRSANTSAKPSAANSAVSSRHHSPLASPKSKKSTAGDSARDFANQNPIGNLGGNDSVKTNTTTNRNSNPSADAKVITEKLLQRTPSHLISETKMSMATAKPTPKMVHAPSSSVDPGAAKSMGASTASGNQELISRFVGGSGTPGENSPKFPPPDHSRESRTGGVNGSGPEKNANGGNGEISRAKSMGNLTRHDVDDDEESALLPRSRKGSTTGVNGPANAYNSRTQQKLWLQRASSNIEPQREGLSALSLLNGGIGMGNHGGGSSMGFGPGMGLGMGSGMGGYLMSGDGKGDPRIKLQLERTGLEYLVVRRHQDPIGRGIKRLEKLGALGHEGKNIPGHGNGYGHNKSASVSRAGSLRERNGNSRKGVRQSFDVEDRERGSDTEREGGAGSGGDEENVSALLRSLWEKSFEGSGSAD
ncbi:hypothetical protein MFRU_006g01670 [Monilinia fructicola]|uniref:TORC1 subunit TCO89 domain-containing protein n=1 Tax=Monilinia fructicola TaxID=38448 RepID=A0A5M9J9Z0_MONFR|nr:hypothetical protein EYC84_009439 [Monilinia fructicola]KAG4032702.1 hypothetical protein MFRU_006g01670 [Monilinia fructicola]